MNMNIHINIDINIHVHIIMKTNVHINITCTTLATTLRVLTCSRNLNAAAGQDSECGCKSIRTLVYIKSFPMSSATPRL